MKWSWKVFTAFGIDVYVHATFLLLILFWLLKGETLEQGALNALLILAVFGCVLLHEFGHALTAQKFGVRTRDITLLPIGGIARLERIPTVPSQEFLIAIAGPAVNLVIAGVLYGSGFLLGFGPQVKLPYEEGFIHGFIGVLASINLWLAVFNFIPAFPMDGGRVLRSLLALKLDYVRATRIAVGVGQTLAFGFGLLGFVSGNFMLILVAVFVYLGAAQEGFVVQYRSTFQGLPTSVAMMTSFRTLQEDDPLEKAVEYLLMGSQVDFPVLRDREVVGVLTRSLLIDSLGKHGPQAAVRSVAIKKVRPLEADMPLDRAYDLLQEDSVQCAPVMRRGELIGLLTLENLAEFAMVTSAMRARPAVPTPAAA